MKRLWWGKKSDISFSTDFFKKTWFGTHSQNFADHLMLSDNHIPEIFWNRYCRVEPIGKVKSENIHKQNIW